MTATLKIGNAQGFWGDSIDAPARLVGQVPDLDFLTLDYLAEVSLSIMAIQQHRDPDAGYARDFVGVVKSLIPLWQEGHGVKIVTNAGGLNPLKCAEAIAEVLREGGCAGKKIGIVTGDNVIPVIENTFGEETKVFTNWENGLPISAVKDELVTANAYIGAETAAEVLAQGADIVLAGRMADPSMTVAPAMNHFGWTADQFNHLAGATIAGHVLECGSQACGGISTHWLELPDLVHLAFPYVELEEDGSFIVTIPEGTGGTVTEGIVKEQLLYELGDPGNYISPDCHVSFLELNVEKVGENRVRVSNAVGSAPPPTYKVSATYQDGFTASGQLTIYGHDAIAKARKSGEIILERLKEAGYTYSRTNIECLGAGACVNHSKDQPDLVETVLRLSVADPDKKAIQRFSKELAVLACGGAQGTTGYAAGRPRVSPVFGYWPCLVERNKLDLKSHMITV